MCLWALWWVALHFYLVFRRNFFLRKNIIYKRVKQIYGDQRN